MSIIEISPLRLRFVSGLPQLSEKHEDVYPINGSTSRNKNKSQKLATNVRVDNELVITSRPQVRFFGSCLKMSPLYRPCLHSLSSTGKTLLAELAVDLAELGFDPDLPTPAMAPKATIKAISA
jgi:hypothetical protein